MGSLEVSIFHNLPLFQNVVEFLDVPSALQLRSTGRLPRDACSSQELSVWRHKKVLPALRRVRCKHPREKWISAPIMTDIHLCWLFDNSPDVEEVDLADAPFPSDITLKKIALECPDLKSFSVRRGQDALRIYFSEALSGLTTTGVIALVENCPRLELLSLSWCESVRGDNVCNAISESVSVRDSLRHLNLDGVRTSDDAIASLASCTNLRYLKMKDTRASDISPLANCIHLETLCLCRGTSVISESVVAACEGFKDSIRTLCCAGCWNLNEDLAWRVLDLCPQLETWNCARGTAIGRDGEGVARLRSHIKKKGRRVSFDNLAI